MRQTAEENRTKQIVIGVCILVSLTIFVCGALIGWRYLPGLMGEWIGMMIGVMTTPFFLEASFIIIGLLVVMSINHWRETRDGDELVYLEDCGKWSAHGEPPAAGEGRTLDVINSVNFLKMAHGDVHGLKDLAFEFFNDTRHLMTCWQSLIDTGKHERLREELHRCKGGASLFGLDRIVAIIQAAERPLVLETQGLDLVAFELELSAAESAVMQMVETFS